MREVELVFDDVMVLPKKLLGVGVSAEIDLSFHFLGEFTGGLDRRDMPSLAFMSPAEGFADPLVPEEESDLLAFEAEGQASAFQISDVMATLVPWARCLEEVGEV